MAPMMRYTDRHFRFLARVASQHTRLYTEMLTTNALLHGDPEQLLMHDAAERPLALQIAGADPRDLATCALLGQERGFDEINLNVGCPSARAQAGHFGACLMAEPSRVAACIDAMRARVHIPVTIKTRIGIDARDSYAELAYFVRTVVSAGCDALLVHARKAWLAGLDTKANRSVPPLQYESVHRLKQDFPDSVIVLNGGIRSLTEARAHLDRVDGVMIGREAYSNPYLLSAADALLFSADPRAPLSRTGIVRALLPYIERELAAGTRLSHIIRHLSGLMQGQPGARRWRRCLAAEMRRTGGRLEVLTAVLSEIEHHA